MIELTIQDDIPIKISENKVNEYDNQFNIQNTRQNYKSLFITFTRFQFIINYHQQLHQARRMQKIQELIEQPKKAQQEDIIDYRNFLQSQIKALIFIICERNQYKTQDPQQKRQQKVQQDHRQNQAIIQQKVRKLMVYEKKLQYVLQVLNKKQFQSQEYKHVQKYVHKRLDNQKYQPTKQQLKQRIQTIIQNDSNWTDATQSVNQDDQQIWVVDDQIVNQMQIDSGQQQIKQQSDSEQDIEKDLQQMEEQFVKGGQSDHCALFGTHDKFCVSVNFAPSKGILASGGGDDILRLYKFAEKIELENKNQVTKPFQEIKHTETINKLCISHDQQFLFSLTDNELMCTNLSTFQSSKLPVQDVKDICVHSSGGAIAVASGYQAQVYTTKKFEMHYSFTLDEEISLIQFTKSGKQLLAACDNKLRILTPKNSQVVKVGGAMSHGGQITTIATQQNLVLTGDIDGFVCATSLKNNNIVAKSQQNASTVNHLLFAGNSYFLCGCAQDNMSWFDINKLKKVFQNQLQGSPTGFLALDDGITYAVSTIKGHIYFYDRRQPLQQQYFFKAGSTVHSMYNKGDIVIAGCEDGLVKLFDIKMGKKIQKI